MSATRATCSFCEGAAVFGPYGEARACASCARRIVDLAASGRSGALATIWSSTGSPSPAASNALTAPPGQRDLDDAFADFKRGVERQVSADDGETHLNLAIAYREMSLYEDAVREAAQAFRGAGSTARMHEALGMLLTAPLLTATGLAALRARFHMN